MIATMCGQCFEALNVYGKTTEQLGTIIKAHQVVLGHHDQADIRKAYTEHLENNSTMPAPADIALRIKSYVKHRTEMSKLDNVPKALPAPTRKPKTVQWAFKDWSQFTDSDKQALRAHLEGMKPEKRSEYQNYLTNHCSVPKGVWG